MNTNSTDRKTILITGGCGYLGSQLIKDFGQNAEHDPKIRILDNMQDKNYSALMGLEGDSRYQFIEGDILDPSVVAYALEDVEVVVHLAAIVQTPMSFENSTWVEQVNHWGTAGLIEACLDAGVKKFVYASSSAVYGPGGPFTEDDICRPFGAYAQSKYKAERSVLSAIDRGLEPVVLRFGTMFGYAPSVRFDAVANRFAYLAGAKRSLVVFGQGDQVRPFVHIRDASKAVQFCIKRMSNLDSQIYNVVGDNASILELVRVVQSFLPEVGVRYTEQDVLTHLSIRVSNEKFLGQGWQPQYSLEDGLSDLASRFSGLMGVKY
jgi:UDP-glucose 4-epimerase